LALWPTSATPTSTADLAAKVKALKVAWQWVSSL